MMRVTVLALTIGWTLSILPATAGGPVPLRDASIPCGFYLSTLSNPEYGVFLGETLGTARQSLHSMETRDAALVIVGAPMDRRARRELLQGSHEYLRSGGIGIPIRVIRRLAPTDTLATRFRYTLPLFPESYSVPTAPEINKAAGVFGVPLLLMLLQTTSLRDPSLWVPITVVFLGNSVVQSLFRSTLINWSNQSSIYRVWGSPWAVEWSDRYLKSALLSGWNVGIFYVASHGGVSAAAALMTPTGFAQFLSEKGGLILAAALLRGTFYQHLSIRQQRVMREGDPNERQEFKRKYSTLEFYLSTLGVTQLLVLTATGTSSVMIGTVGAMQIGVDAGSIVMGAAGVALFLRPKMIDHLATWVSHRDRLKRVNEGIGSALGNGVQWVGARVRGIVSLLAHLRALKEREHRNEIRGRSE